MFLKPTEKEDFDMKKLFIALSLITLAAFPSLAAAEELNYNLVNLSGEAQKHIDNDVLIITMRSSADADSAQEAANIVNQEMSWAQDIIKDMPDIKKQTINYQTHPRYQNKVIVGWSVSQQLQLESEEIDTLSSIAGKLQKKLQVSSMNFGVSPKRKKTSTDELISEALAVFETKARLVSTTIGAKDYRIVTLTIGENRPSIPRHRGYQMEAVALASADAPQIEAGESELTVRVDGTIQLIF
jgi:predicted secreted protein